jgi:hypothetical protein
LKHYNEKNSAVYEGKFQRLVIFGVTEVESHVFDYVATARSNAFNAISRIGSRLAFSGLSVESINSIPSVEVY